MQCDNPYDARYRPERLLLFDRHPGGIGLAAQVCRRGVLLGCVCVRCMWAHHGPCYHLCVELAETGPCCPLRHVSACLQAYGCLTCEQHTQRKTGATLTSWQGGGPCSSPTCPHVRGHVSYHVTITLQDCIHCISSSFSHASHRRPHRCSPSC